MIMKKLSVTIGIILTLAFFASLIAALSSDEDEMKRQRATTEKEYNCPARHVCDHSKEGHKACCTPEQCREMKCDTSMCKAMREKCAAAGKNCNPADCPHHTVTCIKGEKKTEETCTKHAEADKKCDPKTCTGKCPSEKKEGK
jgi:hypothetical protein